MILWLDMFKRQTVRRGGNMSQVRLAVMIINNTRVGWIGVNWADVWSEVRERGDRFSSEGRRVDTLHWTGWWWESRGERWWDISDEDEKCEWNGKVGTMTCSSNQLLHIVKPIERIVINCRTVRISKTRMVIPGWLLKMVVETRSQLPMIGLLRDCGDMGIIVGGRTILMERIGFGRGLRGVAVFLILLTLSPILANSKENTGLPNHSSYICPPLPLTECVKWRFKHTLITEVQW